MFGIEVQIGVTEPI